MPYHEACLDYGFPLQRQFVPLTLEDSLSQGISQSMGMRLAKRVDILPVYLQ